MLWQNNSAINKPEGNYTITQFSIAKKGKYTFQGVVGGISANSTDYAMINVLKNNDSIFQAVSSCIERGGTPRYDVPFYTVCDCNVGDTVSFVLSAPTDSAIRAGTTISASLLY